MASLPQGQSSKRSSLAETLNRSRNCGDIPPSTTAQSTEWPNEKSMTATSNNPINPHYPFGHNQPIAYDHYVEAGNTYSVQPISAYSHTVQTAPGTHARFTIGAPSLTDTTPRQHSAPTGDSTIGEQMTLQQVYQHRNSSTRSDSEPMWDHYCGKWYKWSYDSAGQRTFVWL